MQYRIAYVHYYIHKVFGVGGSGSASQQQRTDPDAITSSRSDVALSTQNALIPSYSEAMRMDHCGRTNVELGSEAPDGGSVALLPLVRGCHVRTSLLSASAGRTTVYGTAIYDHGAGRAFFQPSTLHRSQPVSAREGEGGVPVGWRSRRREAARVHKRKRRRSYAEAVGAPSGSDTSLAIDQQVRRHQRRGGRRTMTSDGADSVGVGRMSTSMSTPESFEKLQNASAWLEQLRPVKSFIESGARSAISEADVDDDGDNGDSSCTALDSAHATSAAASTAVVVPASISVRCEPPAAQSAYDVVGRRVVMRSRRSRDWPDHVLDDDAADDEDDDLPPSYEDALRMRVNAAGILLDDISSVSTTSTYLSSEPGLGDTPRRWKAFVRRPTYAIINPPPFHVETSL